MSATKYEEELVYKITIKCLCTYIVKIVQQKKVIAIVKSRAINGGHSKIEY